MTPLATPTPPQQQKDVKPTQTNPKWDDECAADAPPEAISAVELEKQREQRLRTVAKNEIGRYVRFLQADIGDPASIKNALEPLLPLLDIAPTPGSPDQSHRVWWLDCSLLHEPSEAYCRSHNVFSRVPPFNGTVAQLGSKAVEKGQLHVFVLKHVVLVAS